MTDFSKITALVEQKLVSLYIKRSAKRLQKVLLSQPELETLHEAKQIFSLMRCQEILSQSLGLGNFKQVLTYQKQQHMDMLMEKGFYFSKQEALYNFKLGYSLELKKNVYFTGKNHQRGYFGEGGVEHSLVDVEKSISDGVGIVYFSLGKRQTYQRILELAKEHNRLQDVQFINHHYHLDVDNQSTFHTNTFNPFIYENYNNIMNMIMAAFLNQTESMMWRGRAFSLASAVTCLLLHYRDAKNMTITPEVLREHLLLDTLIQAYYSTDLPTNVREGLRGYLSHLPAFNFQHIQQRDVTLEHHGYLQMQFVKLICEFTDSYPDIYNQPNSEVSYTDVFHNNKILIVLLPEMQTSESLFTMHMGLCLETSNDVLIRDKLFAKPGAMVYFDNCLSHISYGMSNLHRTAAHYGMNLVYVEDKMPKFIDKQNVSGQEIYEQILHKFFHRGVFSKLSIENQSEATKLAKGCYIYQYGQTEMKLVS